MQPGEVPAPPYPPSEFITGVVYDWDSFEQRAPGSDNWPLTWGPGGDQYTTWGDGGGFGGTNSRGRVSLGVARITGDWPDYEGRNIWGGEASENPATFQGKSYGILAIGPRLYMWVSPQSDANNYREARLAVSQDQGASWELADWAFRQDHGVILPTFLQFGPGYQGARDDFVYMYAIRLQQSDKLDVQVPGLIDLMRAPQDQLVRQASYEYFAGLDGAGRPRWTRSLEDRVPVFEDPQGVGWTVSAAHNQGLGRYFLLTEHSRSFEGNLGIFDAPEPWGPWTTVGYYQAWGGHDRAFFWNFSNKWASLDGTAFTLVFSGIDRLDAWNAVRGRFELASEP